MTAVEQFRKERRKFTALICADIFFVTMALLFYNAYDVSAVSYAAWIVAFVFAAVPICVTLVKIWRLYFESKRMIPSIIAIAVALALSVCFYKYLTHFSFDRWQRSEFLRPFMAIEMMRVQTGKITNRVNVVEFDDNLTSTRYDDELYFGSYSPEERKTLLTVSDWRDEKPEVTLKLGEGYCSEVYYAFNGVDLKDYWLVLVFENDGRHRDDLLTAQFVASGEEVNWDYNPPYQNEQVYTGEEPYIW